MAVEAENTCFDSLAIVPFAMSSTQDCYMGSALGIGDGFCLQELQHLDEQGREFHPLVDENRGTQFSFFGSLPVEIAQSLLSDLEKQRMEMDWFLQSENKRLRRLVLQEEMRQQSIIMQKYESVIRSFMLQKDEELAIARNKAQEVQDFLKVAEIEAKAWEKKAREKEAIVSDLNNKLNQAKEKCHFFPNAAQENDAMSICGSSSVNTWDRGGDHRKKMACKSCKVGSLCVVLFPCRHLCCCKSCEALLGHCPVCGTVKEASLEVCLV